MRPLRLCHACPSSAATSCPRMLFRNIHQTFSHFSFCCCKRCVPQERNQRYSSSFNKSSVVVRKCMMDTKRTLSSAAVIQKPSATPYAPSRPVLYMRPGRGRRYYRKQFAILVVIYTAVRYYNTNPARRFLRLLWS